MKSRALRLTLLGMFVAAICAAAYVAWMGESQAREALAASRNFDAGARATTRTVFDLRQSQQAYVAAGQGEDFWVSKVTSLTASLRDELRALRAAAVSPIAQSHLDESLSVLRDFEKMDLRAREYARGGQRLLASDLIFSDGFEKTGTAAMLVEQARDAEAQAGLAVVSAARRSQVLAAAGVAALGLLTLMALVPVPRTPPAADATPVAADPPAPSQPVTTLGLARDPRDGTWSPLRPQHETGTAKSPVDLSEVASLCTELARVVDTRALPRALERAGAVLDASGLVLWIADPDGRELNPIVSHGYPPHLVTRLGTIPRDAENVTAAAFRTSLVQTVNADSVSNGAIAAPLVTPAGCVGVIAAEVRHGGEKQDAKLAAAAIVAAQLATLVGPPSSRTQGKAEAAGA